MSKMSQNQNKKQTKTEVITFRIPTDLFNRFGELAKDENLTKTDIVKRYLNLSNLFTLDGKGVKTDYANQTLILYPATLIKEVFNLISKIPKKDQFYERLVLGDKLGLYINSITTNMGIKNYEYRKIFDLIERMGWFKWTKKTYREAKGDITIILIPTGFASKALVYAMVYRIITRKKYPDRWDEALLNQDLPFPEGDRKNRDFETDYKKYVDDDLEPDLEQESLGHYYFKALKILVPEDAKE